jgi:hypothetical protein
VKVVTVRISPDDPVHVNELRTYGVEPITLSLTAIPATVAYAPEAVSVSGYVDVRAEALGPNVSAYRVVVTNRSPFALMWFQFKAYRSDRTAISGRPRGKRNLPLMLPNANYTFEIATTSVAGHRGTVRKAGSRWIASKSRHSCGRTALSREIRSRQRNNVVSTPTERKSAVC